MTDRKFQRVRLKDGPLAGKHRHVRPFENLRTFKDFDGPSAWTVGGREWRRVTIATYRRVDETTWEHVRTPTTMNDTDLETLP